MKNKLKKLRAGYYIYRGYKVNHVPPFGWEAVEKNIGAFAHAKTLSGTMALIDFEIESMARKNKIKPTEKKYEYAVRMHNGEIYGQSDDIEEVRDEVAFVNADGLIVCGIVRREVGEWEEVK